MGLIALVLGGADCVWRDADAAFELFRPDAVYACNDIGARWPGPINVWCTLHPEKLGEWIAQRARRGHPPVGCVVAPPLMSRTYMRGVPHEHAAHYRFVDRTAEYQFEPTHTSPSSGIYAGKVAHDDGYRVVFAGVPMTREGGHFVRGEPWVDPVIELGLRDAAEALKTFATSMSGATRQLLGAPTTKWLESGDANSVDRSGLSPGNPLADRRGAGYPPTHRGVHPRAGGERQAGRPRPAGNARDRGAHQEGR